MSLTVSGIWKLIIWLVSLFGRLWDIQDAKGFLEEICCWVLVLRVYSLTPRLVHTLCFLRVDKSVLSQFPDAIYGLFLGTISQSKPFLPHFSFGHSVSSQQQQAANTIVLKVLPEQEKGHCGWMKVRESQLGCVRLSWIPHIPSPWKGWVIERS